MLHPISSISYEHKVLVERYANTVIETIAIITGRNKSRYNDFIDITNIIIAHHNGYKHDMEIGNFYDFLSIIPTNLSVAVQAFLAGMETNRNRATVRAYRLVLTNLAHDLVNDLQELKLYNE